MAQDRDSDVLHLYDCAKFRGEQLAVIAEGLNARGRGVGISWEASAQEVADKLLDRGCNLLKEPVKDTPMLADMTSREILGRMRTGRFKVDKRLAEWLDEFKTFFREEAQVPLVGHPLMTATRHAVARLEYAAAITSLSAHKIAYPKVPIV
ncbi:putative DNA packaging protein GP2 [Methyloceanibacter caenitepidi]|uniref:Putative DNA packaging protein GP2 n=1 Tax=Methyloceanibacter caenitepidi TaxID=1384459 RepID=A0A0A8K328_9HYPH|nr:putative DNA packaging protein GP2 [Methyloceanibacter caenitepidi]